MRLFPDFFFNLVLFYFLFFFENNEQPQLKVLKKLFLSYMVKRAIRFMEFCFYLFILSIKWRKKFNNACTLTMFLNLFQNYLKKNCHESKRCGDDWQVTIGEDDANGRKVSTLKMGRWRERESFSLFPFLFLSSYGLLPPL